jgi:hypothetical protein
MKNKLLVVGSMLAFLGVVGCGGSDVDAQTAGQAMSEAMQAGMTAYTKVAMEVGNLGPNWITGTASSFEINGTVENTAGGGGSAAVTGSGSRSANGFKMDLKLVFSDWKSAQGLILNGPLNISYDVKGAGIGGLSYTMKYSGDLEVSGSATGTASFDLTITVSGMTPKVCGTVGGHDVSYGGC